MNQQEVMLRAIEPEDLDLLYQIENDIQEWGVGNASVPYSRYMLHQYITNSKADIYADCQMRLVIQLTDGTLLGLIDVIDFDPRHRRAEVGIVIRQCFRRKTYASQAIAKLIAIVHQWNIHQLYAIVANSNEPAFATFSKAGFTHSATLSDWLCNGDTYEDATLFQMYI